MPPLLSSPAFLREFFFLLSLFLVGSLVGYVALGAPVVSRFEVLATIGAGTAFAFVAAVLFAPAPPR